MKQYYRLEFYVPASQVSLVKNAVFETGAGRLSHYDHCSWETSGKSQMMIPGAPGQLGTLRTSEEIKVEVIVAEDCLEDAVNAVIARHPSEQPVLCYYPVGIAFPPDDDADEE